MQTSISKLCSKIFHVPWKSQKKPTLVPLKIIKITHPFSPYLDKELATKEEWLKHLFSDIGVKDIHGYYYFGNIYRGSYNTSIEIIRSSTHKSDWQYYNGKTYNCTGEKIYRGNTGKRLVRYEDGSINIL